MSKLIKLFLAASLLTSIAIAAPQPIDSIAAVVNNRIVTQSELQYRIALVKKQLASRKVTVPDAKTLQNQVLQLMINESLQQQTAHKLNISVSTTDVQKAVQNIAAQQGKTPQQFQALLKQEGIAETDFIAQIRQQLLTEKLLQATVARNLHVSPQEIEQGMKIALSQAGVNNEYHLLNIVVPLPETPTTQAVDIAKQKAERIATELTTGVDFQTIAAAEGGQGLISGGDMGWVKLAQLPPQIASAVLKLPKGGISDPIQTADGFHIVKLVDTRGNSEKVDKTQLRERVANLIFQRKLAEKQQQWLEQLRSSAFIKIMA